MFGCFCFGSTLSHDSSLSGFNPSLPVIPTTHIDHPSAMPNVSSANTTTPITSLSTYPSTTADIPSPSNLRRSIRTCKHPSYLQDFHYHLTSNSPTIVSPNAAHVTASVMLVSFLHPYDLAIYILLIIGLLLTHCLLLLYLSILKHILNLSYPTPSA